MAEPGARDAGGAPRRAALLARLRSNARPRVWAAGSAVICMGAAGSLFWTPAPFLLWNASPSTIPGLYLVAAPAHLETGDIVVAWAPRRARDLAAARSYLPLAVPLVKPVAAVAGDRVCAAGRRIFIQGRLAALRQARDPSGRPLPWWSGCRMLRPGELFLLSERVPLAFDGRYFGVTSARALVGKARLLWAH